MTCFSTVRYHIFPYTSPTFDLQMPKLTQLFGKQNILNMMQL